MDNTFSLKRFGLLAQRHFNQYLKTYIISSLVFAGITTLLFLLTTSTQRGAVAASTQFLIYIITIYTGLFIFTSGVFSPYQRPREAIFSLMLPASSVEKYTLGWLLSFLFYTICANGIFFTVHFFVMQYYGARGYVVESMWSYDWLSMSNDGYLLLYLAGVAYLLIHAVALLGSTVFRKRAALKSALGLLVIAILYRYFNVLLSKTLASSEMTQFSLFPFLPSYAKAGETSYTISVAGASYWMLVFSLLISGLLWVAAYFKLKEKEV